MIAVVETRGATLEFWWYVYFWKLCDVFKAAVFEIAVHNDNDNDVYFTLATSDSRIGKYNKKAVLSQGNRAMPQLFFSV